MKTYLGHRVNLAKKIRKKTKAKVVALGMMNSVKLINRVCSKEEADLVAVSRRFVHEPYWLMKEYIKSKKKHHLLPEQYLRCL